MRMVDRARFRNADKYASYLKTMAGRLRLDLAWENLRPHLPGNASKRRALDLGGGTGSASVKLAEMGFEVVLLDSSKEMLGIAQQQAKSRRVAARMSFRHTDAHQLSELFAAGFFDVVVCHNLLEYVDDPCTIVRGIAQVLRKDGAASVLARNRAGEVLRAAIKSRDWGLVRAYLSAETAVDSLFGQPVRMLEPAGIHTMLAQAGLEVVAEYGVRVFSDYLDLGDPVGEAYRQLLELELILGARPEFAAIARYTQVIARPASSVVNRTRR
jgi:S-adenosylmethionine-dependent methyltransferase